MKKIRQREADTEKTRQRIIAAADTLISERGLNATSVSEVARALDMSHANVYRHFKSREDLLVAVARTWMSETRQASEAAICKHATPAVNLTNLVLVIRKQLFRRAANMAALDLYHFALKSMPEEAIAHHKHRAELVAQITGSSKSVSVILDALRGFTDPNLLLATDGTDTTERIEALSRLLCKCTADLAVLRI